MTVVLGELLIRERVITPSQLSQAMAHQKREGYRLGESLVSLGMITSEQLAHFFQSSPPLPHNISQTGLSELFLTDLLLKIAHSEAGVFSLQTMARAICLPNQVVDALIELAKTERLIAIRTAGGYSRTAYVYELTERGRERAEAALAQSKYAGAAPVPLLEYNRMTAHQTIRQIEIDEAWIHKALAHMVVSDLLLLQLGPAFNSGRSIFLYGPPGTGKSTIAEGLAHSLEGEVFIPYAVEVSGQIIRLFDPEFHIPVEPEQTSQGGLETTLKIDPRWRQCRRPMVMVGGELTLDLLDLDYDPTSKFYEAPVHMKASNGVFILDDFGRQQVAPRQLLNRWIVPLERGTDFLALHTGKKFEIPFDQITVFCTNLRPSELVDEAFLRRIRHKIQVQYLTEPEYLEILRRVCEAQGIAYNAATADYLLDSCYRKTRRPLVGSHPRDLVDQIMDHARFHKIHPELTPQAIDLAAANYFVTL